MTTDDLSTARLDVSVEVLTAAIAAHPGEALAYREAAYLVTHPEAPVSTDADYPGWVPPHTDPDFARSVTDGFVAPVRWDDTDCEPEFATKPVVDVQTGGVL